MEKDEWLKKIYKKEVKCLSYSEIKVLNSCIKQLSITHKEVKEKMEEKEKDIQDISQKYLDDIEDYAKTLLKICEDYGEEIGELIAERDGAEAGIIARKDAEKSMLISVIRYMLDYYLKITVCK